MVYEVIFGRRTGEFYISGTYSRKWETDLPIVSLKDIVTTIGVELKTAIKRQQEFLVK